mmetsp:Transcript_6086/g.7046  ORF Transcript_6086/g.7046 Transcript_6086/m.7046 type:complete len:107 (-) Transcript_6086:608-928(-)
MKADSKNVQILAKPLMEIYQKISEIYQRDGLSLEKWLTESTSSNMLNNEGAVREEVTISTYKEQFKNMLSLDIWIDELLAWQANDYKLQMPNREPVDPLKWNNTLK